MGSIAFRRRCVFLPQHSKTHVLSLSPAGRSPLGEKRGRDHQTGDFQEGRKRQDLPQKMKREEVGVARGIDLLRGTHGEGCYEVLGLTRDMCR